MNGYLWLPLLLVLAATAACTDNKDDNKGPWGNSGEQSASIDDIRAVTRLGSGPTQVVPRAVDVPQGFRGEVHSLLAGQSELQVSAELSPIRPGRALGYGYFPTHYYDPFTTLQVAQPQRAYSARELSRLLPEQFEQVGQIWTLDLAKVSSMLRQFHPGGSTTLRAPGRRAGPNGAYGMLRAASDLHYEILFRAHGEFQLGNGAFLTPSCFWGRMLLNRQSQSIDWFNVSVPQDQALNATLSVGLETEALIDIVKIESMALSAGNAALAESIAWQESLSLDAAQQQLKSLFFKFMDIQWTPPEQAMEQAQQSGKPIMAVVLWGCLDEQNC